MSASELFETTFGAAPTVEAFAPGRVNLIGEHIDYSGGMVLPMPVALGVSVALSLTGDTQDRIASDLEPGLFAALALNAPNHRHWSDYASGALQLARKQGWIKGGVNLALSTTLPAGAGLSSSAATIVAVLKGCLAAASKTVPNTVLARHAQAVETEFIGMPCGIMDQMAVIAGKSGHALALQTDTLDHRLVPLPGTHDILVVHTGITRKLEDGRYGARRGEAEAAAKALGVPLLCRMTSEQAAGLEDLPAPLQGRARHSWTEHQRVLAAAKALEAEDAETLGALMVEAHRSYSADFEASTPDIDVMVEAALELGATGARLTGGGFGGCLLVLTETARTEDWCAAFLGRFPGAWRVC